MMQEPKFKPESWVIFNSNMPINIKSKASWAFGPSNFMAFGKIVGGKTDKDNSWVYYINVTNSFQIGEGICTVVEKDVVKEINI